MPRGVHMRKRSEWVDRLRRFSRSNLSVTEFCRGEKVSVPSYYHWRRKLTDSSPDVSVRRRPTRASFVPVQVTTATDLQVTFPNGVRLTLPALDYELVRMSIEAIALTRTSQGDA
jgi:hypothetical protein